MLLALVRGVRVLVDAEVADVAVELKPEVAGEVFEVRPAGRHGVGDRRRGASAIETVPGGYRLALDGDELDTARFERLAERGRALAATGDAARAASAFARALALWRGHPLEELDGWPPGRSEAARLEELRRTIEEDLLDARLAAGEHRRVAVDAEALVVEQPWRERRWAILALARYRCGRQADALESIRVARRTLVEDLGLDPGASSPISNGRSCARTRRSPRRRSLPRSARRARTRVSRRTAEGDAEGVLRP